jgi:hypothetical protein
MQPGQALTSLPTVDITTVSYLDHQDEKHVVVYFIKNPIATDS